MLAPLVLIAFAAAVAGQEIDPATNQLADYLEENNGSVHILTTATGAPVDTRDLDTLNTDLLSNEHLIDSLISFVRERIPERLVHAKGTGAFGYFEVTHDITHICKADFLSEIGKKTPVAVRFSISAPRSGGSDAFMGTRGMAVKFYTKEGNFDLTGFNIPIFGFRDPLKVIALTRNLKTNPATDLADPNITWDFSTLNPETLFGNMYVFAEHGIPANYRNMGGFPVHTFQVYNEKGINSYVRFHFLPVGGIKNLNTTTAQQLAASDPDFASRDLYNAIANGDYPSWYLKVQILSEEDRKNADMDIFDVSQVLPLDKYPLHPVGMLTLDKNILNHFAEMEQIAFCPGNLVPGVRGSPDKIFEARRLAYKDSQNYRLGCNSKKIPVNCPIQSHVYTYHRDGRSPTGDNGRNSPNYHPNSFDGVITIKEKYRPNLVKIYEQPANNFKQAGNYYAKELTPRQRDTLVTNILATLSKCVRVIQCRAIKYFTIIHSDLGKRVARGLGTKCTK